MLVVLLMFLFMLPPLFFVLADEREVLYIDLEPAVLPVCSVLLLGRNYICFNVPVWDHTVHTCI